MICYLYAKVREMSIRDRNFEREFVFATSKSSGPGGQHVNKVNTRVELRFFLLESEFLSDEEKEILRNKLAGKINRDGSFLIVSQSARSQIRNKEICKDKFYKLIEGALKQQKKRKATLPHQAAVETRLKEKKIRADKKIRRKNIGES